MSKIFGITHTGNNLGKKRRINTKKKKNLKNRLQAIPISYTEDSSILTGKMNLDDAVE